MNLYVYYGQDIVLLPHLWTRRALNLRLFRTFQTVSNYAIALEGVVLQPPSPL